MPVASDPNIQAVQRIVDGQADAWNRGDGVAWAACFTIDASFVNIMGMTLAGRAHIGERHGQMFRTVFRGSTARVLLESVTALDADTLLVRMEHVVTGQAALPPGISPTDPDGTLRTRMLYVMTRDHVSDAWLVVAAQNTPIVPAAAIISTSST